MTIKPTDFTTQTLFNHLLIPYQDEKNFELACALHRGLKWELVALEHEEEIKKAAVRHPEGGVFDARGHLSDEEFLNGYDEGVIITFALEAELNLKTRLIIERDITEAGKLAMCKWPDLPWHKDTHLKHLLNFFSDLEKISKHHGFWLENNRIVCDGTGYGLHITGYGDFRIRKER